MLMAHSTVLRMELQDSKMAEKGDVPITDSYPDTFKNLLRYVYGYDVISVLSFDEADNLLYIAEKYMMAPLKSKLSTLLISLLTPENVCTLFNNPARFQALELGEAITEILQCDTSRVLDSPQFLNCDSFVKILEQDGLAVPEIEVWRAAVKWAKHKAGSEDGQVLRRQLSKHTQHIRVCTLSINDFLKEVVPTRILTGDEVNMVCLFHGTEEKPAGLVEFSCEIKPRLKRMQPQHDKVLRMTLVPHHDNNYNVGQVTIVTKRCGIELLYLHFQLNVRHSSKIFGSFSCDGNIQIARITDDGTSTEDPITVMVSDKCTYGAGFRVPVTSGDGRNVRLLPNSRYLVKVQVSGDLMYVSEGSAGSSFVNEYISVCFEDKNNFVIPMKGFSYSLVG